MRTYKARIIFEDLSKHQVNVEAQEMVYEPSAIQIKETVYKLPLSSNIALQGQGRKGILKYPLVDGVCSDNKQGAFQALRWYEVRYIKRGKYKLNEKQKAFEKRYKKIRKGDATT